MAFLSGGWKIEAFKSTGNYNSAAALCNGGTADVHKKLVELKKRVRSYNDAYQKQYGAADPRALALLAVTGTDSAETFKSGGSYNETAALWQGGNGLAAVRPRQQETLRRLRGRVEAHNKRFRKQHGYAVPRALAATASISALLAAGVASQSRANSTDQFVRDSLEATAAFAQRRQQKPARVGTIRANCPDG
jgi:hypothetical protein